MDGKPGSRAQQLYRQLRGLTGSERELFLAQHARDEPEATAELIDLCRRIEQPTQQRTAEEFGPGPFAEGASQQTFANGEILAGRFLIEKFISLGGMGEVYAAEDLKLGGKLAVKTVRHNIASDPLIIDRFRQEIALGRRITHPNVCRIFDLASHHVDSREVVFLTMELLEGESMAAWMAREGPISTEKAAPIVLQALEGLSAAHRIGVIHQDFKPSNVFLVSDSRLAVVMDFGLARPMRLSSQAQGDGARKPFGGTPSYMSPEQLAGEEGSVASDIYSVGVVLYELVTGQTPFEIESAPGPSWQTPKDLPSSPRQLAPNLDPRWERVILSCLAPQADKRPADVDAVIDELTREQPGNAVAGQWRTFTRWPLAVVSALLLATIFIGYSLMGSANETIQNLTRLTSETDLSSDPALSRDGKLIAYTSDRGEPGNQDIWLQSLPAGEPRRVTTDAAQDYETDLSPDGSKVAFRSDRDHGGIYVADTTGGPEHLLAASGRRPKFSPNGKWIIFWTGDVDISIPSGRIFVIAASGGDRRQLAMSFADAREPQWSPDGQAILFKGCLKVTDSLETCDEWWVQRLDSTEPVNSRSLTNLRSMGLRLYLEPGGWYPDGVLFSASQGDQTNIWRVQLSRSFQMTGKPQRLTTTAVRTVNPAKAENGTVAFGQLNGAMHVWQVLPDKDESNNFSKITNGPDADSAPSVSQDGRWMAYVKGRNPRNVWLKNMESGRESLLKKSADDQSRPVVSPSGNSVAFNIRGNPKNSIDVWSRQAGVTRVCEGCGEPMGWRENLKELLLAAGDGTIAIANLNSGKRQTILAKAGTVLGYPTWSNAAQYLLFTESQSDGRKQVFAAAWPALSPRVTGSWIPISSEKDWSDKPQWSADGRTLYYLSKVDGSLCIWARRFDTHAGAKLGAPFAVKHFHSPRATPDLVFPDDLGFSVSTRSIVLNVGEASETIWTGTLGTSLMFNLRF